MTEARRAGSRVITAVFWSAGLIAATALGLYARPEFVATAPAGSRLLMRVPGPPPDLPTMLFQLGVGSINWYALIVACPLLLLAARRIDAERLGRARALLVVTTGTTALITTAAAIDYVWSYWGATTRPTMGSWAVVALRQHALPWIALVGIVAAVESRRRMARAAVERERLRAEVAEQRLIALAGQLRPHFLFNALQAVSTLIHRDPDAADEMLGRLSDLLRDVLQHRDSAFVRLEDEVRYARTWLEIAKVRFADRLTFDIDVPADLHDLSVPLFVLQPLVENALSHGIGGVLEGGRILIRARLRGKSLVLDVIDDGAGLTQTSQGRDGIGLANTRERLQASFGSDQRLTLEPQSPRGTCARVEMPARPAAAGAAQS